MARKFNLATLVSTQFADATREEMNTAYEIKFNTTSPIISDDELRERLIAAYTPDEQGDAPTLQPPTAGDTTPKQRVGGNRIPNLRPTGKWEGRMRRVTIHKTDENTQSGAKRIGWEGILWTIAFDTPVDMPWPYWQSLINTDFIDDRSDNVTKWVRDETGKLSCERTSRAIKTVRYTDHGDVPGTEHLPEDYVSYFRSEALRTNCFNGFPRAALMMVHNILLEPAGDVRAFNALYFRDLQDVDLRIKIAGALGPQVEDIMNNVVYAEAS